VSDIYCILNIKSFHEEDLKTYSILNEVPRREDVWGSGVISLRILNLDTRWSEWSASPHGRFTPEDAVPQYPMDRRLCGTRWRRKKKSLSLPEIEPRSTSSFPKFRRYLNKLMK